MDRSPMKTIVCGVSKFKMMTYKQLRELKDTLLVEEYGGKPIVAVVPYREYLEMQNLIIKAYEHSHDQ